MVNNLNAMILNLAMKRTLVIICLWQGTTCMSVTLWTSVLLLAKLLLLWDLILRLWLLTCVLLTPLGLRLWVKMLLLSELPWLPILLILTWQTCFMLWNLLAMCLLHTLVLIVRVLVLMAKCTQLPLILMRVMFLTFPVWLVMVLLLLKLERGQVNLSMVLVITAWAFTTFITLMFQNLYTCVWVRSTLLVPLRLLMLLCSPLSLMLVHLPDLKIWPLCLRMKLPLLWAGSILICCLVT